MKKYKYEAVNINKKKFTGTFLAENERDLASQLAKQNLYLISAKVTSDEVRPSFFSVGGRVKMVDLTAFCRQFSIMLNSGMSIVQTLDVLKAQDYDRFFKSILENVYEDVKTGVMLSDALAKHKKVFPNFFKSMIKVGEASGKLDVVMISLADYYDNDAALKKKTKGALAYPIMLLMMTIGIVVLMMLFVVPTFKDTLKDMNVEMPPLTQAIADLSDFIKLEWKKILVVIGSLVALIFLYSRTEKGKYTFDTLAINFPLLKTINVAKITARFARGFSLLLSSGMDIIEAMEEISAVIGNRNVEKRFKQAIEDVRQGMTLTMAFESYKLFPDILIQMVSVGERTASLEEVLSRSCAFFDEQADSAIKAFTSAISPIMLLIMGGVVGVLFIAIYSPMLQIMTTIGK
ncbi:bacterial type II secretion system F domain protein [Coprobacillus sp. CAG:698]|nr:bacterial type II secretion system F domain protein [Coprobacillus sp. CAG:698]